MTNTYMRQFVARCPNNDLPILYSLSIMTDGRVIPVEDILEVTDAIGADFHETIADRLHGLFGGHQTLVAHHHGVDITTVRGGA